MTSQTSQNKSIRIWFSGGLVLTEQGWSYNIQQSIIGHYGELTSQAYFPILPNIPKKRI